MYRSCKQLFQRFQPLDNCTPRFGPYDIPVIQESPATFLGTPAVAKEKKAAAGSNGKAISKMEAMRQTLGTLGKDAKPKDIDGHLKSTFGITMSSAMISNYKGLALKGGKKKRGRKPGQKTASASAPASAAPTSSSGKIGGYSIDDIRAVQELAGRLGAKKLKELAEVLAK
jgi:hypothetical protein